MAVPYRFLLALAGRMDRQHDRAQRTMTRLARRRADETAEDLVV